MNELQGVAYDCEPFHAPCLSLRRLSVSTQYEIRFVLPHSIDSIEPRQRVPIASPLYRIDVREVMREVVVKYGPLLRQPDQYRVVGIKSIGGVKDKRHTCNLVLLHVIIDRHGRVHVAVRSRHTDSRSCGVCVRSAVRKVVRRLKLRAMKKARSGTDEIMRKVRRKSMMRVNLYVRETIYDGPGPTRIMAMRVDHRHNGRIRYTFDKIADSLPFGYRATRIYDDNTVGSEDQLGITDREPDKTIQVFTEHYRLRLKLFPTLHKYAVADLTTIAGNRIDRIIHVYMFEIFHRSHLLYISLRYTLTLAIE